MVKKQAVGSPAPEWDPTLKEPWHLDFEKEEVNDERWTCIVTAAVQAEAQTEESIQIFTQCANTGLRKAIKVIKMADVVKLLKEVGTKTEGKKKNEKPGKLEESDSRVSRSSEIVVLAAKYATFTDVECKLPPDLMAAVLKYLILTTKDEHYFWKRVEWMKARKKREDALRAKFIRDLKPYQVGREEGKPEKKKVTSNILGLQEPIDDEPFAGPDLYIMLTDFYDLFCFPELLKINVPFVALLRITCLREPELIEMTDKKGIAEFWEKLKENCISLEKTIAFKDIAMMEYQAPVCKAAESKQHIILNIFDELSWMLYSAYLIYRQHQKYLQELYVQRLVLSLEPLDLSRCDVYNKLCDALITGEPLTASFILYAIIEQVVVGVPHTESTPLEYEPAASTFFPLKSESDIFPPEKSWSFLPDFKAYDTLTPCEQCRKKKWWRPDACEQWRKSSNEDTVSDKNKWTTTTTTPTTVTDDNATTLPKEETPLDSGSSHNSKESEPPPEEFKISVSLIDQVLRERKSEKELRRDKKWKSPRLLFYADSVALQTYHCDPRIFDCEIVIKRLLKNSNHLSFWSKYPELSPQEKAFYNYHFFSLLKMSGETEQSLKLKIAFTLSMKSIGISKFYLYRGEEENMSEMVLGNAREKLKKFSRVKFDKNTLIHNVRNDVMNFSNYFFKMFMVDMYQQMPRKAVIKIDRSDLMRSSIYRSDSFNLQKVQSQFSMYLLTHRSSGMCTPYCFKTFDSSISFSVQADRAFATLGFLLDCFEISNLTEPNVLHDRDEYVNLVQGFKFFEELESNLMVQRLLEAQENYNSTQCSYFPPTDSLIITMQNDFDYRGVFYTFCYVPLPTPLSLRDFYNYVYPEISDWLVEDDAEYQKFTTELQEKTKEQMEKCEAEYLSELKLYFCQLSEEERKEFLEAKAPREPAEEEDLEDLPIKPKISYSNKVSFVTTNFLDVRVELRRQVNEYYSRDGTEVNIIRDSWLYQPLTVLSLVVKKSGLTLNYYHLIGVEEINTTFSFRTISDIIFVFYKNEPEVSEGFNCRVKISWPVGLLIDGVPQNSSGMYVKQGYLKVYRRGWEIEQEQYRCYLKNGQMLIFKENGDVDILTASGTIHSLREFDKPEGGACERTSVLYSRCETTTTCGEVWEKKTKGPCRNKKKLITTYKIYIGVDPKTQETFYRRDDGVQSMLWPSGKLVTKYPDGTKITSIPDFDEEEVFVEWTSEEKILQMEKISEQVEQPKSRTILRNPLSPKTTLERSFSPEGFVSVSCSYLMEHPKYSSVRFTPSHPYVEVKIPEQLSIKMYPEGNYHVTQENSNLRVQGSIAEFYTNCSSCNGRSIATLDLECEEVLCELSDLFQKVLSINRNGETTLRDLSPEYDEEDKVGCNEKQPEKTESTSSRCDHFKNVPAKQRCFVIDRDMSGIEFLHGESLAQQCYVLPEETFYDLHSICNSSTHSHTFSSPQYKVGYEGWVMEYEDKNDFLPVNLKRNDLREMGVKDNSSRLYKHPFPKNHDRRENNAKGKPRDSVEMPKVIITRIIKSFSQEPKTMIDDLHRHVAAYQKRAHDICKAYKYSKPIDDRHNDSRYVEMRLRKIALTLTQNLHMYPHLCTRSPSTEKDIHYFGHFINAMEIFKSHFQEDSDFLPDCKQIPRTLPRCSALPSIHEEGESPRDV